MQVSFGINTTHNNIFDGMIKPEKNNYQACLKPQKPDTFELKNVKEKIKNNKKALLISGAVIAAAIAFFAIRKNSAGAKTVINSVAQNMEQTENSGVMEDLINQAKTFLVDDVQKTGTASVNGICFYGPDSIGKEQAITKFIEDIKHAGYKIENAPRTSEASSRDIGGKISELIKQAEQRFINTKQRTAIVVRDLDKIAMERTINDGSASGAVSALINMQDCRMKGIACISEAVDITKVDPAVARAGRMEYKILTRPSVQDSKGIWDMYLSVIEKLRDGGKKDKLFEEAKEIIMKKGI